MRARATPAALVLALAAAPALASHTETSTLYFLPGYLETAGLELDGTPLAPPISAPLPILCQNPPGVLPFGTGGACHLSTRHGLPATWIFVTSLGEHVGFHFSFYGRGPEDLCAEGVSDSSPALVEIPPECHHVSIRPAAPAVHGRIWLSEP